MADKVNLQGGKRNFTKDQLLYAYETFDSNKQAYEYFGCSKPTWKKYATVAYVDSDCVDHNKDGSDTSVYQALLNKWNRVVRRDDTPEVVASREKKYARDRAIKAGTYQPTVKYIPLEEILQGKHPDYPRYTLKKRLVDAARKGKGIGPYQCSICGFKKRSMWGGCPLFLDNINWNKYDFRRENLRFLCYNCSYMYKGFKPDIALEWVNMSNSIMSNKLKNILSDQRELEKYAKSKVAVYDPDTGMMHWESVNPYTLKRNEEKEKKRGKPSAVESDKTLSSSNLMNELRMEVTDLLFNDKKKGDLERIEQQMKDLGIGEQGDSDTQ